MIKRVYLSLLLSFIVALFTLNVVTFLAGFDKRQLVNFFYLPERTNAALTLISHIVFESGLILERYSNADIEATISELCRGTNVAPELAMAVVQADGKIGSFTIYFDGSVGAMHISKEMLNSAMGMDPFILKDNIKIGISQLSMLIDEGSSTEVVLRKYFALPRRAHAFTNDQMAVRALADKAFELQTAR